MKMIKKQGDFMFMKYEKAPHFKCGAFVSFAFSVVMWYLIPRIPPPIINLTIPPFGIPFRL